MTAFARAEKVTEQYSVTVEIRSLNSKYLDLYVRLAQSYMALEDNIKKTIAQYVNRGRIDVSIIIKETNNVSTLLEVDWERAEALHHVLIQLQQKFNITPSITVGNLLTFGNIIKPVEMNKDIQKIWVYIEDCLVHALTDLDAMRCKEGSAIAADFVERLGFIENELDNIKNLSESLVQSYFDRLTERISIITKGQIEIDQSRIAQEAAFLADRSDISEETVRIESHLQQFRDLFKSHEPVGRKLNFIIQEFGREINTIGSKSSDIKISQHVVSMKSELEKLREQVQNVE
jgi:uncharacterized protein (TIGR00255 family)